MIVPQVAPPPAKAPMPVAKERSSSQPITESDPSEVPDFSAIPIDPAASPETPVISQQVRRRAKRKGMNPLIPMALFGVVVAVVVFAMWQPGPKLEGQLAGVKLEEFTIPPAVIDKTTVDRPAGVVSSDLKEMQNDPPQGIRIPDWFEMQFHPEPGGLKVAIKKTTVTEVFRVNTGTNSAIREFFNRHKAEILKRQQAEFRPALKKFFGDWETFHKANAPFKTEDYRGSLGFNALGGPLGFCVEAKVGPRGFRCVHQDGSGDLYFLLPKKTTTFVLRGRTLADGSTLFPGHYTVKVQGTKAKPEPASQGNEEPPPAEPRDREPSSS